jgi:hypothetical protein
MCLPAFPQTFPGAYLFYNHINQKHTATLTCDICGKTGIKKEKLAAHKINYHLPDHEKPYVCDVCGKGFAHKTKLESHQVCDLGPTLRKIWPFLLIFRLFNK